MKIFKRREILDLELQAYKQQRSIDEAFKEDGITDNKRIYEMSKNYCYEEWVRQRLFAKEDYYIDKMMNKIKIRKKGYGNSVETS